MVQSAFESFLDATSECFINRDFELWRSHICLPFSIASDVGLDLLSTDAELRENFDHYLHACDVLCLDKIYRVPIGFERCDDGLCLGTYETNLMSGQTRVVDPYVSTALLEWSDQRFRMRSLIGARGHYPWTNVFPKN